MKKLLSVGVTCVISAALFMLVGCNTVQGIGKDVSKGGKDIQRAAS